MFITSELFQARSPNQDVCSHGWMDDAPSTSVLGKRRRNGDDEPKNMSRSISRKIRSPQALRTTRSSHTDAGINIPGAPIDDSHTAIGLDVHKTEAAIMQRDDSPPIKSRRSIMIAKKSSKPVMSSSQPTSDSVIHRTPLLTPCHICHFAPRLKTDLQNYAGCGRCAERTCYICIRQCQAGCGHRKICRDCCTEEGKHGDVRCLDCLASIEDHEMEG